jgi:endonuclease III
LIPQGGHDATLSDREADLLQALVPSDLRLALHVNFISLGREICLDPRPKCDQCPLSDLCPTGQGTLLQEGAK